MCYGEKAIGRFYAYYEEWRLASAIFRWKVCNQPVHAQALGSQLGAQYGTEQATVVVPFEAPANHARL